MGIEYRIRGTFPADYDCSPVLRRLPSPISPQMTEIYNYKVEKDGFYLVDHCVDSAVASQALRIFLDEALRYSDEVSVYEP